MGIDSSTFSLLSVQAVLFTPGGLNDQFRTSDILASVLPNFARRYDGEVESAPVPASPRPISIGPGITEVGLRFVTPGVTLKSDDGKWVFKAAPLRVDSIWTGKVTNDVGDSLQEICRQCLEPLIDYPAKREIQIGRLALVVKRCAPIANPAIALASQFCRAEIIDDSVASAPLRHSRSFRIDNLKRYTSPINSFEVNSWVRCQGGQVGDIDAITVEQDINTLHENESSTAFSTEQIRKFFLWGPDELDKVLSLFFPSVTV